MTNYTKPSNNEVNKIWATTAPTTSVQTPEDSYINLGWTQVKPPSEYFNWWMKKVDTFLAYSNQKGIPEWDSHTEYQANSSFVQYDGKLWLAIRTHSNSAPSSTNWNWREYLDGFAKETYVDDKVLSLKNSLHKVATSGLASDLQGYLPWTQLSDIPQWIRETHTDNGQLYMRAPDGTQYRLGNGRLDFFNTEGKIVVSCDPSGNITVNTVQADRVYLTGGGSIFSDSSKDILGITNKSGDTLYIEPGNGLTYSTAAGKRAIRWEEGKLTVGEVPKERITGLGSMSTQNSDNVDITGGKIRVSYVDLSGGGGIYAGDSVTGIKCATGDTLYVEPDALTLATATGDRRVRWEGGKLTVGEVPFSQVTGYGRAALKGVYDTSDWTSIPWDGDKVITSSTARSLADQIKITQTNLANLNLDISRIIGLGKGQQGDSGYIAIPYNNGSGVKYIYLQWTWWSGNVSATSSPNAMFEGSTSIKWPVQFPNDCSFCIPSVNDVSGGGQMESVWLAGDSNTSYDKTSARIQFATKQSGGAFMSGNIFGIGF